MQQFCKQNMHEKTIIMLMTWVAIKLIKKFCRIEYCIKCIPVGYEIPPTTEKTYITMRNIYIIIEYATCGKI